MTKVRDAVDNNKEGGSSWWSWFVGLSNQAVAGGMGIVQFVSTSYPIGKNIH